jgi:hypothetical protein
MTFKLANGIPNSEFNRIIVFTGGNSLPFVTKTQKTRMLSNDTEMVSGEGITLVFPFLDS